MSMLSFFYTENRDYMGQIRHKFQIKTDKREKRFNLKPQLN